MWGKVREEWLDPDSDWGQALLIFVFITVNQSSSPSFNAHVEEPWKN